jgi:dipeptidyl-peptidase-4
LGPILEDFSLSHKPVVIASLALGLILASTTLAAQAPPKPLTISDIFAHGPITGEMPNGISWSPDGRHLTYIDGGELIDIDPVSGKSHILVSKAKFASMSGAAGSEKDRDHRDRYKMASYQWAPNSAHLLFDSNGSLFLYDLKNGTGIEVGHTGSASGDDPKFSPNGEYISFVRDHGLSVLKLGNSGLPAITVAGSPKPTTLNGEVDWVYEEELEVRSNYAWAPDSRSLAFLQMDEESVPQYPIADWIPTHATVDLQRYPQPGDPNPDVRIGVVGAKGGKTQWVKIPFAAGHDYIPRFGWVNPKTLWIETLTRDHKHRTIYFVESGSSKALPVLEITDEKFIDDNYDVSVDSGTVVLTNWTDGHNHLYLYSYDANNPLAGPLKLERQLTKGDFEVTEVLNVDHAGKVIQFASNEGDPLQQQLWQVSYEGDRKQLSSAPGFHIGIVAPVGGAFVDRSSTRVEPASFDVCSAPGKCTPFWSSRALEPFQLHAPQQLQVKAHDGTTLYATLLLPDSVGDPASVPLIVNPYGGPGPETVANRYGGDGMLFDQLLAQHGYAVLHADNRGMGARGRDFAQAAYHNFGPVQLEDQLTVVDSVLAQYPQLDSKRLGWWGWSWGGTFTLYALSHSDRFRAGVCVAPVTDWVNYDSIYTERYMSQPSEFSTGYHDFSVVNSAANLKGHLLLVHGTGDDNVHIENTVQFVQKLIEAQIPYDLQIYPRKTHSIAGPDVRTHLYTRILAHFDKYLKPPVAPSAHD